MTQYGNLTRPWEIWLVHHTHVDIGYTEPQDVILRKHAEFVAQALDLCTATDPLPPGERFCWTCEVSWTVKAFLARYPGRAAEFFRRVREGRIEVTALYLQLTDLFTQELLEETTDYALDLARRNDFDVVTAMNDDVNGWTWGLPDLLSKRGVRFMDTAINETRALGVRPRPALFRWTGPKGGSLLFWHANIYLYANAMALDQPGAAGRVTDYLQELQTAGYPHHIIELRIHGANHDNAPPGIWLSDLVRRWNTETGAPKLRLITPRTWFEEAAAKWPAPIMEHRAGWPDWWADGNGTAAAETALVRRAQAELNTVTALEQATGRTPPADRLDRARDAAAFFCEHTWGAWCSTDAPFSLTSRAQWNTKAGYAYTAAVEADALRHDLLAAEAASRADRTPGLLVFNPSREARSDLVELVVRDDDAGFPGAPWIREPVSTTPGPAYHLVDETTGKAIPVSRTPAIADSARRPAQTVRFVAEGVPAGGFRRYRIGPGEVPGRSLCAVQTGRSESPALALELAANGAGIAAVRGRHSAANWLNAEAYALGEVVYETIPGPFGREKLTSWDGIKKDCPLERTRLRFGSPEPRVLPYGIAWLFEARELPDSLRGLMLEVVVYDALPRLDLCYRMDKIPVLEAEALYVAFPLGGAGVNPPSVWLDLPGAAMRPGLDQVPGTATDWHSVQHGFMVSCEGGCVAVASPDMPLVQVNGINTGLWQEELPPHNGLVMSWVFNNYWFTNFPAAQGGTLEWRYSLCRLPAPPEAPEVTRFLRDIRQPLMAAVMPLQAAATGSVSASGEKRA